MKSRDYGKVLKDSERSSQDGLQPPPKKKENLVLYLAMVLPHLLHQVQMQELQVRLTNLSMNLKCICIDESPLQWWKLEFKRLPLLSIAARKYLCVCATSVTSERVFSIGGQVVNSRRSCLKPHKVNSLIFLAKNFNSHK